MRITTGQFAAGTDKSANADAVAGLVERAAMGGADLVVLPEFSIYNDPAGQPRFAEAAEPLDGPFVSRVAGLAKEFGVHVIVGTLERIDGDDRASNTLVCVDDSGQLVGTYRKQHLYDAFGFRESDQIRPGELGLPLLVEVAGVSVGALTCYDLRFPEGFRLLVDAGAQVIALPAAWVAGPVKEDHWVTLIRARAIENTVYVAAAGQTGPAATGQSMIVDPLGTVIAGAGERPGLASAEISLERLEQVRARVPVLANRRYTVVPRTD